MANPSPADSWKLYRFGLLVTGKGESFFLDRLFRSICGRMDQTGRGSCHFQLLAKIGQLQPRTSPKRVPMPGKAVRIPTRDEDFAQRALGYFKRGGDFVLLVDDLESSRRAEVAVVYTRYRTAFDHVLPADVRWRASVHFLVNMLEAYYFADAKAINAVCGTDWADYQGDVETIAHPKRELQNRLGSFDQIQQGQLIMQCLDVPHILSRPETCASLRTLFAWCWRALGLPPGDDYQLEMGCYFEVTRPQIEQLPPINR